MSLMRWQPFREMSELDRALKNSFQSYPERHQSGPRLALDIFETEEELVLRASLPGADKSSLNVEFENHILTVSGTVPEFTPPEGGRALLKESIHGEVRRSLKIPHHLDIEKSTGTFQNGVLEVHFLKAAEQRKRTITIE